MFKSSRTDFMAGLSGEAEGGNDEKILDKYLPRASLLQMNVFSSFPPFRDRWEKEEKTKRHYDFEGKLIKMIEHHDVVVNNDSL